MDINERVANLENLVHYLSEKIDKIRLNLDDDIAEEQRRTEQITPYTDTKIAYYGETFKIFYEVPQGNVLIFFDNFNGEYTFEREEDRLYITFKEPLTEQTHITISIQ